jgi:phospho-N-acetylmuramoyl-pentapeptide-transferase
MTTTYISTFAGALIITAALMPALIRFFKSRKSESLIRELGPDHSQKVGTPSMGGVLFVAAAVVMTIIGVVLHPELLWQALFPMFAFLAFAVIGGIDDGVKLFRRATEGLAFKPKLLAQTLSALVIMLALWYFRFPFVLTIFDWELHLGWFYFLFLWFWLVGWSNATNLTDGLDGLMAGLGVIVYGAYTWMAYNSGFDGIVLFNLAVIGSLLGFLIFNKPTAKIFMGDTGSLALGAGLAMQSILLGQPWSLLWFGFIFVIETLSVIIQTFSYHFFKKRVFPMAPIHHSFEQYDWSEWEIDALFWIVALVQVVVGILIWSIGS